MREIGSKCEKLKICQTSSRRLQHWSLFERRAKEFMDLLFSSGCWMVRLSFKGIKEDDASVTKSSADARQMARRGKFWSEV